MLNIVLHLQAVQERAYKLSCFHLFLFSFSQAMNEDVGEQKSKARDALSAGKKLLNDHAMEDESALRTKMDDLKQKSDAVSAAANERLSTLEQALPLARHFHEAHMDLVAWLDEVEPAIDQLDVPSVDAEQVKKQQEQVKVSVAWIFMFSFVLFLLNFYFISVLHCMFFTWTISKS